MLLSMPFFQRKRKCFFILIICGVVLLVVYFSQSRLYNEDKLRSPSRTGSLICRLPKLSPFEPTIMRFLPNISEPRGRMCPSDDKYFQLINGRIEPKSGELPDNIIKRSVRYQIITRNDDGKDTFTLGPEIPLYKGDTVLEKINNDFVKVTYRLQDKTRKTEVLNQVAPKSTDSNTGKDYLNVVLMGFDSSSTANFLRQLPRSAKYLRRQLDAYIFRGYSIVGDGTTPALSALLTGISLRANQANTTHLNEWSWIMKEYKSHGYVTLYAEDDPQLACFNNFKRGGFKQAPADHYARPYWLAVEQYGDDGRKRNKSDINHRLCYGSEPLHTITMGYTKKFLEAYNKTPKFSFSYFSYLPHGTGEHLHYADDDLLKFLKYFNKWRENTVLIIFGDHGARIGALRNTIQGQHEEHLPWFSIVVPDWFRKKYPSFIESLEINRNIITTPFDVHHTLHHILNLDEKPVPKRSLFTPFNIRRSCLDAGVDDHWCPCFKWEESDVNDRHITSAANLMIRHINRVLSRKRIFIQLCSTIYLVDILAAAKSSNAGTLSHTYYSVTIATNPGGGTFQGTFHLDYDGRLVMNLHFSRTNMYGRNPWCLPPQYKPLRKYCACRRDFSQRHETI